MLKLYSRSRQIQKLMNFQVHQQVRQRSHLPFNTVFVFVPQQEAWVVERMGKFNKILEPGLNILAPVIDSVKYVQSLKEIAIDIPQQSAITADNVTLQIDGVLYIRITDPYMASYGVEDAEYAITQLAQTTMRSELGKIQLDTVFKERDSLNYNIVEAINKPAESWGIDCKRYEIRDMTLHHRVQDAMQMQVEAERKKRAAVLESEGMRAAAINVAEGKKRSRILTSEAYMAEAVNQAKGEAEAIIRQAEARAEAVEKVAKALGAQNGHHAVSVSVAEKYIAAFGNLAKEGNTVLLPTNSGDVTSMVAQAMSIYTNLNNKSSSSKEPQSQTDSLLPAEDSEEMKGSIPEVKEKSDIHGLHKDTPDNKETL